ncbi:hypothetical protein FISHEDRAFT_46624 [Fistulina hepatica ATCC 64428]|uniref:Csf1 N-terminal domain-containing protein n=1 Tax=Fistulina hepatica ATCC 64428 TaxID=1128425 RepID=A0A0D7A8Q1_9AGAR|nr:hypothetical protein FISHEDRAFT_46624 [Fistulina hepatica ATCC 64428]
MLNILFLVACVCIVCGVVLYLFFWNRLLGFLFGEIVSFLLWNRGENSIRLKFGSIHLSILTGRILFKGLSYHSSNQTVKIVKGKIQWRYWIRRPMNGDHIIHNHGSPTISVLLCSHPIMTGDEPCRVHVTLDGFEWFIYNRTPSYENIIAQLYSERIVRKNSTVSETPPTSQPLSSVLAAPLKYIRNQLPSFELCDILPIGISGFRGVIVIGNQSTPNLLFAEFGRADGFFGVVPSRSKFDLHRQMLTLNFEQPVVRYVDNVHYFESMDSLGKAIKNQMKKFGANSLKTQDYFNYAQFSRLWRSLKLRSLVRALLNSGVRASATHRTHASVSALDEGEYAIERRILEAPVLEMVYYSDVPGVVPAQPVPGLVDDIGNGDIAPEWDIELGIQGGTIRYGPWADRQRRVQLQKAFFPPTFHNGSPTMPLQPGETRMFTALRVFVDLRDMTTLHVPFREASKDWEYDGKSVSASPLRSRKREHAFFRIMAGDGSSISYVMPLTTTTTFYESMLEVHLDNVEIRSSLNDITLVAAESMRMNTSMPSPLIWNAKRAWTISVGLRKPVLYLLRDHINMITDLVKDWASGPPSDYLRWVPTVYTLQFELLAGGSHTDARRGYEVNVYTNDLNIIDRPLIRDENALLTLRGMRLTVDVTISADKFRPDFSTVKFNIDAPDLRVEFSLPRWNTHAIHTPDGGYSLGQIGKFEISGSYLYWAHVCKENVDILRLDFKASRVAYKAMGWTMRYFMVFKDNYFGTFTHFSTLHEFLEKLKMNKPIGDPVVEKYRPGRNNMMEVEMSVVIEEGLVLLPCALYAYERKPGVDIGDCLALRLPELQVHFRMHDFFMEMSLNVDPVSASVIEDQPQQILYFPANHHDKKLFTIDGIVITANRFFGPVPQTLTYVAIWEIQLGCIDAAVGAAHAKSIMDALNSLAKTFVDIANAPSRAFLPPSCPDLTMMKLKVASVNATWLAGNAAAVLSLPGGVHLQSNDHGGPLHRKLTSIQIPVVSTRLLLSSLHMKRTRWVEALSASTDLYVDMYSSPVGWRDLADAQAEFLREQDELTGRVKHMFAALNFSSTSSENPPFHANGVYIPHPYVTYGDMTRKGARPFPLPRQSQARLQVPARRWTTLSHISESEREWISEYDGSRVLRTDTPLSTADERDTSMSSGDESDNEDLTDGYSSDSDFGDPENAVENALFRRYTHVSRHYWSRGTSGPGHSFVLIRDIPSPHKCACEATVTEPSNTRLAHTVVPSNSVYTTTFRVRLRNPIQLQCTPLALPVVTGLLRDTEQMRQYPELFLDRLMSDASAFVLDIPDAYPKRTILDINIPCVFIQILQHMTVSSEDQEAILENLDGRALQDVMGILELHVRGTHILGDVFSSRSSPGHANVHVDVSGISLSLSSTSNGRRQTQPSVSKQASCSFTLSKSFFSTVHGDNELVLGDAAIRLGHVGPGHLLAVVFPLTKSITKLVTAFREWKLRLSERLHSNVFHIIQSLGEKRVIDPLSIMQPSYLVQAGLPHRLRTDIAFRLLFHLRSSLWERQREERWRLASLQGDAIPVEKLRPLLERQLMLLDYDDYSMHRLRPLYRVFPKLKPSSALPLLTSGRQSVSIQIDKFAFQIVDPSGQSPNEVLIGHVYASATIRPIFLSASRPPQTASLTSLLPKDDQVYRKLIASVTVGNLSLTILPHIMVFAQRSLRVRRHFPKEAFGFLGHSEEDERKRSNIHSLMSYELMAALRHIQVQAIAESLIFQIGARDLQVATSLLTNEPCTSGAHAVVARELFFRACTPESAGKRLEQNILASLSLAGTAVSFIHRMDTQVVSAPKLVFALDCVHLSVPRSALRLYRFVQEWRADFLPGFEAAAHAFMKELHERRSLSPKPRSPPAQHFYSSNWQVNGEINACVISLHIMLGTWLSAAVHGIVVSAYSPRAAPTLSSRVFGIKLGSEVFTVSSKPSIQDADPNARLKLTLPSVSLQGHVSATDVHTFVLIETLDLKFKPSYWDTLLVVQQKFDKDFNDLLDLIHTTKSTQPAPVATPPNVSNPSRNYTVSLKMRGFRIGLESAASILYFECEDIHGCITTKNTMSWDFALSDLALSLASRSSFASDNSLLDRTLRSAFFIIDIRVRGGDGDSESLSKILEVKVPKIHAVMQPSSIGELGDFTEIFQRKEQRAQELAAFKDKTQSILRSFEVKSRAVDLRDENLWLNNYYIDLEISRVGIAFPVIHDGDLALPKSEDGESVPVRAFLISIDSITFRTQRGETGQASMSNLSFQFVSKFRQSIWADFSGSNHRTLNRLLHPNIKAQLQSIVSPTGREIWITANVSGFIFDIDPSVVDNVFSLIDVYRRGKDRIAQLSLSIPRPSSSPKSRSPVAEKPATSWRTTVFASLTFMSGQVVTYSQAASNAVPRSFSRYQKQHQDAFLHSLGGEVFNLPVISVWTEYRSMVRLTLPDGSVSKDPSVLMFNATVHSSQNTLRPTLLPFLTELIAHVEDHLTRVSKKTYRPLPLPLQRSHHTPVPLTVTEHDASSEATSSSMRISFSLRIDQSKLELTCQPDVNVIAGVHWDSGGFILNISPGARQVTFTGSVGGLTVGLKHGFLSEDCVKLDARNLVFSINYTKMNTEDHSVGSVSVVLDTEFWGVVRFSRLQDVLCFNAVWLDRIPVFNQPTEPQNIPLPSTPVKGLQRQELAVVVVVRIRQTQLNVDLGQSISVLNFIVRNAVMRTKLTNTFNELSLSVTEVNLGARGNLAGRMVVSDFVFQTIRMTKGQRDGPAADRRCMLELRMTSGPLVVELDSDHQKLLHYRAEPMNVEIYDDWSEAIHQGDSGRGPLRLLLSVSSSEITVVGLVSTIPKLLAYSNKLKANLTAQRAGASRESRTFRITRTPKPDHPLSAVAEAMLVNARSRFKESSSVLSYVIKQNMSLRLTQLRLVVFPRTMGDVEAAQFEAHDIAATLDRVVHSDVGVGLRGIRLSFSSMAISKLNQVGRGVATVAGPQGDGRAWFENLDHVASEATVVGLPAMRIHMVSHEGGGDNGDTGGELFYDFHSRFVHKQGGSRNVEDIYITLNVSLYAWLTVLRKSLTREMDQIRTAEDWRVALASPTTAGVGAGGSVSSSGRRKQPPEPLKLQTPSERKSDAPKSATSLPGGSVLFSPTGRAKSATAGDERNPPGMASPAISATVAATPSGASAKSNALVYRPQNRNIERLTMRQLGEATPDVMHPFFMKKAGFSLEDSLPQYVHEYATTPLEAVMEILLKLYSKQLLSGTSTSFS